jgi:hypothetical protein
MEQRRELTQEAISYYNRMPRITNAAGTMWSSITDYTKFMHHLMFSNEPMVREIFKLMTTEQVDYPLWNVSWGLGIGLQDTSDQRAMWHWGSDDGFKTFTISYLDQREGITIFTNGQNGFDVYSHVFGEILHEQPKYIEYKLKENKD